MKIEEERPQPKRVFAVNVIHNEFDGLIHRNLNFTHTPYSSRVRHGYILRKTARSAWSPFPRPESGQVAPQSQQLPPFPVD